LNSLRDMERLSRIRELRLMLKETSLDLVLANLIKRDFNARKWLRNLKLRGLKYPDNKRFVKI
jgi:hypothetical protein